MITVDYLADRPQHLPTVAGWIYDEWHRHRADETLASTEARFREMMRRDAIPLTLVAVEGGVAVGTASLYLHDMATRPDLTPWLAAVYVAAGWRRAGVGAQLVRAAEHAALQLGVARLYLFTPDQERLYARLGWRALERTHYDRHDVVIMARDLAGEEKAE